MSAAGRAQYDVLRIMRGLSGDDDGSTSARKSPRTHHLDVLTSEDILKEKYQELGHLLAAQFVERKALTVLESTLLVQKKRRKGKAAPRKNNHARGRNVRPSSAKSFASEGSSRWYDSDYTDYTEASAASSGKRVSFADDIVSMSGESSVVITEITDDDTEFEKRIKRKPRLSKEEEDIEALELNSTNKRDIEKELIQSILRSPRPKSARNFISPSASRSTTATTSRRRSPERVPKEDKQRNNYDEKEYSNISNERPNEPSSANINITYAEESDDNDDNNLQSTKQSRKKSPRKGKRRQTTPSSSNNSPRKGRKSSSPTRKGKGKSPRKTQTKEKEEDQVPPELQQSPRKELDPIDNQLTNSKNKHIKSWLRQKDVGIRRQKKDEQKKEQVKREAKEKEREERAERLEESREKYNEWVNRKKRLDRRAAKNAFNDGEEKTRPITPGKASSNMRRPISIRKAAPKEPPKTTHDNRIGIVRDYDGDWTQSVNFKRDLAGERERDEERRQGKEAKKRERILKAKLAAEKKKQPKVPKPKRSFPRGNSSPGKTPDAKVKVETTQQKPKTKPSSNPFKNMTYDQWLNQKMKTEQTRKEEADKEIADPDLKDLIPLLAKHRIAQAKEPSRRVDSGLHSRPKSSGASANSSRKPENKKAFDNNNGNTRPYTWNSNSESKTSKDKQWKSFPIGTNSYLHVKTPTPPQTPSKSARTGSRKGINDDNVDVLNSVRPEPQGCEIPSPSHCQGTSKSTEQDNVFMTEAMVVT